MKNISYIIIISNLYIFKIANINMFYNIINLNIRLYIIINT